ncbi:c-type cytochrome [bacterium]|nr:c-type cytochrome [bacterium]MBU1994559.1 c-type cytochrome [bacterium]
MKNIIVAFFTLLVLALMAWTASGGRAYHGGEHAKVIEDFGDTMTNAASTTKPEEKSDREKENEALGALRDKAGNAGAFKVSQEYKSKCASCHGVNGSGEQNGKKLMGPKLFGQSSEAIYKNLVDFKDGRKENMIMKGLLIQLNEDDLKRFSDEIGEFPDRAKEIQENN